MERQALELKLTRSEALVLHDLLNRISGGEDAYYEDAAEQYVLWRRMFDETEYMYILTHIFAQLDTDVQLDFNCRILADDNMRQKRSQPITHNSCSSFRK